MCPTPSRPARVYSHSRLSAYEDCPLKYKLNYIDGLKRETEGIEAFVGSRVHEVLRKAYDDARLTKVAGLEETLAYYDRVWEREWHEDIVITRKGRTAEEYRATGRGMVERYYRRFAPFNADTTIETEMRLLFDLDGAGRYRMQGYIDRLSRTPDGVHHIHDYKTSGHLPPQEQADRDRQLGLYQLGVQKRWPDVKAVSLVWHYLAFDRELVSSRSPEAMAQLASDTMRLIDEVESARDFPPLESALCAWCEYPDLCPLRKHLHAVEALPPKQFLGEPGVVLVNRYAELKDKAAAIDEEMDLVREALVDYARKEGVSVVRGSGRLARVRRERKLRFPGKNEPTRVLLDDMIARAGKWMEVSQLDTAALGRAVEGGRWDKGLAAQVSACGQMEETATVWLSKVREED